VTAWVPRAFAWSADSATASYPPQSGDSGLILRQSVTVGRERPAIWAPFRGVVKPCVRTRPWARLLRIVAPMSDKLTVRKNFASLALVVPLVAAFAGCGAATAYDGHNCGSVGCPAGYVCHGEVCDLPLTNCQAGGCPDFGTLCKPTPSSSLDYMCSDCASDRECVSWAPSTSALSHTTRRCVSGRCQLGLMPCSDASQCPPSQSCTSGVCVGCVSDAQCTTGDRQRCVDGQCMFGGACFDGTQCGAGQRCVEGACVPSCNLRTQCPTGFSCDAFGTCSGTPGACGAGRPACAQGFTCVEEHCVPSCASPGNCAAGLVCVGGGCIPDQFPKVTCFTEGKLGDGSPNECPAGRLCVQESCYVPCDIDAGAGACGAAGANDLCKSVMTPSGDYHVCGSATNLGSECGARSQSSRWCSGSKVCIDGFCM